RLGAGDWVVVEADESDGSFVKLPATIAVVTNIDPEHLDFYGTVEAMNHAYEEFVKNVPFYGFATLCLDHPVVQAMIPKLSDRRIVTYGLSPQADVRADNIRIDANGSRFDVAIADRLRNAERRLDDVVLPMMGTHNVQNALAAIAVAAEMEIPDAAIRNGLAGFSGVKRRFTKTGEVGGIVVIDDYGHHPVEIAAALRAARAAAPRRVVAVVQPHRYSRLASLFEEFCTCFNDADHVVVADVYAAGESPIEGIDRDALVAGLQERGHRNVTPLADADALPALIADLAGPGDFVVCLGAGTITYWANALPDQLRTKLDARAGQRSGGAA
ncbi:MAG: Mur ligase family protein, partial [Dongiaceae bacterium]